MRASSKFERLSSQGGGYGDELLFSVKHDENFL